MTKAEAIQVLKSISAHNLNEVVDALYMAIEALQTPPISQRSMYQAGYKQGQEDRPKGEWKCMSDSGVTECDQCGWSIEEYVGDYNFCPNCGADMRGEDE